MNCFVIRTNAEMAFFPFPNVFIGLLIHKDHNPKRMVCLASVRILPCYLLNRRNCVSRKIFKKQVYTRKHIYTHTQTQTSGSAVCKIAKETPILSNGFCCQPWTSHPCTQALILHNKVAMEVMFALNVANNLDIVFYC